MSCTPVALGVNWKSEDELPVLAGVVKISEREPCTDGHGKDESGTVGVIFGESAPLLAGPYVVSGWVWMHW